MKKLVLFLSLLATISTNVSFAQLKVLSTGAVETYGRTSIMADMGKFAAGLEVISNSSYQSDPFESLLWIYASTHQPYDPGLLTMQSADGAYVTVKANGRVGIFNSYPSVALEIGSVGSSQQVKVNGTIVLGSDARIKENIKNISNSLNQLKQIRSVSYSLRESAQLYDSVYNMQSSRNNSRPKFTPKANPDNRTHFGFLAQDVQKIFPELVYKDSLGMLGVDYIGMIPLLVNAVKEQQIQIDAQAKQIESLSQLIEKSNVSMQKVKSADLNESIAETYPVLDQNIPNPFNTATKIGFYLPTTVNSAVIYVYDMNGAQLKNFSIKERGKNSITIQGSELNAGMYLYALIADGKVIDTKRMILTK